uniref:NADH:ubiquinone reductase (H(+)-translocating) n=1 Tax=Oxyuris equi TaxID=132389 RepID=A0A0G2T6E6_9BILA|nr:NADH dehydrogenase subunit 5 [Oxyuris equi]AKI07548.1 NADH dehydrogenase subunit 5 [Oxyuris equi]
MNVSIFFVFGFIFFVCVFLFFVVYGVFYFVFMEWYFLSLKFNFYVGSFFFSVVLLFVTLSVILFSTYYMEGELNMTYFLLVFWVFVMSMFFLNFSVGVLSILVSWDVLGVSSFFLVLFYNNWDSCSGAMNTVLTNRVGDFFLFLFMCFFFFGSQGFYSMVYGGLVVVGFLVLAGFTKSAQFPFSGWLPKAMSAPTPVSALVHSSTLVTAGLILMMSFTGLILSYGVCLIVFGFGLLTMFFSSICALVEQDMKKVVALSTLSQMGFSMMTLGMGLYFVSLMHLVSHALFKSCLFIQVGIVIHSYFSQQDSRNYVGLGECFYFVQLQMLVTLFCLCGLFFTSGSVTKDVILEFFFWSSWSWVVGLIFFVGVFFTFLYSYRLFDSFFKSYSFSLGVGHVSLMMGVFSFFLIVMSVVGLWWLVGNFVMVPVLYLYVDIYVPLVYLIFVFLVVSVVVVVFLVEFKFKFLVDYSAKQFGWTGGLVKFFDVGVNYFLVGMLSVLGSFSLVLGQIFKNYSISIVVVVFLVLVFIV